MHKRGQKRASRDGGQEGGGAQGHAYRDTVIPFTIKSSLTGFALLGLTMQTTLRSLGACGPPQATPRTMLLRCHRHGHLQATQHDKVRPTGKRENRSLSNPVASDSQSLCQVRLSHDLKKSARPSAHRTMRRRPSAGQKRPGGDFHAGT